MHLYPIQLDSDTAGQAPWSNCSAHLPTFQVVRLLGPISCLLHLNKRNCRGARTGVWPQVSSPFLSQPQTKTQSSFCSSRIRRTSPSLFVFRSPSLRFHSRCSTNHRHYSCPDSYRCNRPRGYLGSGTSLPLCDARRSTRQRFCLTQPGCCHRPA